METGRVFNTFRIAPALSLCRPTRCTRATVFSSCSNSSCAFTASAPPTLRTTPRTIAARRALRRAGRNLPLLGSLFERALTLHPSQRIVGEDQDEQRSDHGQTDLLEADVRLRGESPATERLYQRHQDVSAVEDGNGEQIEGHDGDVDHRQEVQIGVEAPLGLLARGLRDE